MAQVREDPLLQGVTFSGGEPFCQPEALCTLARRLRPYIKDLVVYSGYTLEQLEEMAGQRPAVGELLALCDVLIDGPYIEAQRDLTLQYRGSANQRVIQAETKESMTAAQRPPLLTAWPKPPGCFFVRQTAYGQQMGDFLKNVRKKAGK